MASREARIAPIKRPPGREPISRSTAELAAAALQIKKGSPHYAYAQRIATGETNRVVCKALDVKLPTAAKWRYLLRKSFRVDTGLQLAYPTLALLALLPAVDRIAVLSRLPRPIEESAKSAE